jgi:hypothetical protein
MNSGERIIERGERNVSDSTDHVSSASHEQITEAYLRAIRLIDLRVAPLLGKATTRALVQGAARRVMDQYPFLSYLVRRPYTDIVPSTIPEQFAGVTAAELTTGLDALLDECFAGLQELAGDLIAPPLHIEVTDQLRQMQ